LGIHNRWIILLSALCVFGCIGSSYATSLFLESWGVDYEGVADWDWTGHPAGFPAGINFIAREVEDFIPTDTHSSHAHGINGIVGPGWGGERFDAEAMFLGFSNTHLYVAVVTGVKQTGSQDPWRSGSLYNYEPGDIRLQFNGSEYAVTSRTEETFVSVGTLLSGNLAWQNPRAFFSPSSSTDWGGVSNPYAVTAANNQSALGANFGYNHLGTSTVNSTTRKHYAIEAIISYASLGLTDFADARSKSYDLHWTMECGNDAIDMSVPGAITPIPEPATLMLLGAGLPRFGLRKRKKISL
jgi:hypothetical protein